MPPIRLPAPPSVYDLRDQTEMRRMLETLATAERAETTAAVEAFLTDAIDHTDTSLEDYYTKVESDARYLPLHAVADSAATLNHTLTPGSYLTGSAFNGSADVTFAVDGTSTNTANTVVVRDSSGNFAAGTITVSVLVAGVDPGGAQLLRVGGTGRITGTLTLDTGTAAALSLGTHLSGGTFNSSANVTITVDATSANTASTIVARDASGNFSAGTITATITGHSSLDLALAGGTMTGSILFSPDATYDIGALGATRPANVYVATALVVGADPGGSNPFRMTGNVLVAGQPTFSVGTNASTTLNTGTGGSSPSAARNNQINMNVPHSATFPGLGRLGFQRDSVLQSGLGFFGADATPNVQLAAVLQTGPGTNAGIVYVGHTGSSLTSTTVTDTRGGALIAYGNDDASKPGDLELRAGSAAGSGLLTFYTNTSARFRFLRTGHFVAVTDNTLDIGAVGATRPRTGYFGTSIVIVTDPGGTDALRVGGAATINTTLTANTSIKSPIHDSGSATDLLLKRNATTILTLGSATVTFAVNTITNGNADFVFQRNATTILTLGATVVTLGVNTLTNGNADLVLQRNAVTQLTLASLAATFAGKLAVGGVVNLKNYTVATLPAGVRGDIAYVTDALTPAFLVAIVGGGAVVTPVFYDGTNWVAY